MGLFVLVGFYPSISPVIRLPTPSSDIVTFTLAELDSLDFTSQLCDNIKKYGNTEDIYSLVTSVDCALGDSRPLVISTLTRKFYLTPSDHRGHHFHIRQYHDAITKHLEEIKDKLRKAEISGKTKHSADLKRGATPKTNLSPRNGTGSRNPSNRLASLVETVGGSRTSANGPVSSVESDGGSSSRSTSGKRRTAPSRTSANRADEGSSSRTAAGGRLSSTNTSRSRLSSTKSDGNLTSTVPTVKDRWKY